ncbi:MAG TPA: hypothetical protein VFR78_12450 [Pyrinomonadaceae bacterium]|nr:hypothetical protein [Pyrinomonadaceae bacterium]
MKITNKYNLPAPLVKAVTATRHESDDDPNSIRVSGVIQPVQLRALMKRHDDEIEEDAADRIFSLMGTLLHDILEKNAKDFDHCTTEEALTTEVLGWKITGHYDLSEFTLDGELLTDWKLTSVYAMKDKNLKPEWDAQVNIYAELQRLTGKTVSRAQIVAIGRDWSKSKASREADYPQRQVIIKPVTLWPSDKVNDYLRERVAMHQRADREGVWPECTEEERWARPAKWAIMKKGNKKATKLCYDDAEAQRWLDNNIADSHLHLYSVEHRPGESVRCESYCPVSEFCPQWAKLKPSLTKQLEDSIKIASEPLGLIPY